MKTKSISQIFNQSIFRVPDYQRGYSWTIQHLEQFWDDLQRLRDEGQDHYTGLITIENVYDISDDVEWLTSKSDYQPYYIVDGQQRLTTIIILIQSIVEKLEDSQELNLQSKDQIRRQYICIKKENLKAYIFGYDKDDPSYEFLKTKIFNEHSSNSLNTHQSLYTQNLAYAKLFFENKISKYDIGKLEILFRKVTLKLKFNLYEIDNDLDVFVMFETMNNRGKPLSKLEILKNRLIYLSTLLKKPDDQKTKIRKQINNSWKTIYEYLGKNTDLTLDDDEFLKNHTFMYFGYKDKWSDIYADFLLNDHFTTANIYSKKISIKSLERYVRSIQNSVIKWFDIKIPWNGTSNTDEEIKSWLKKLTRIKSAYFLPSIMGALLLRDNQDIGYSKKNIIRLLKEMERFAFLSFYVFKRNSNYKKNYFLAEATKIYNGAKSLSQFVLDIKDSNEQQPGSISTFHYYLDRLFDNSKKPGFYGWNGLTYFLYEFEINLQGKENQKMTWDRAIQSSSIEHIYPQNPDGSWKPIFHSFNGKQRSILCNSLGNLLLISQPKNSSISNKEFAYKKKHATNTDKSIIGYFNGSHSEIGVAQYEEWTANEILERGMKMLHFMEERWKIKFDGQDERRKILFLNFDI